MTRKLHIGGTARMDGWEIFDVLPGDQVDHLGDAVDLSRFADEIFSEVYASHVLEHFDYKDSLAAALKEWARILVPGGKLYLSVPDLETLAQLLVMKDKLSIQERFEIMRMIFGGHVDPHDYHFVGFTEDFLGYFLDRAGFVKIARVPDFGLFDDTSRYRFKGVPISLNVTAMKAYTAL